MVRVLGGGVLAWAFVACNAEPEPVGTPPVITLDSPQAGEDWFDAEPIPLEAHVDDADGPEDVDTIRWTVDGVTVLSGGDAALDAFGRSRGEAEMDAGTHTVEIVVTDKGGNTARVSVSVDVQDGSVGPEAEITSPESGADFYAGQTIRIAGTADSARFDRDDLRFVWSVDDGGGAVTLGDGKVSRGGDVEQDLVLGNPGAYTLSLRITDPEDGDDRDSVQLTVRPPGPADSDADGYTEAEGDCNDGAPNVHPGAPESENGRDDDCDGIRDDGTAKGDDDGDGFCESSDGCASPNLRGDDCDDADPQVHPGAHEVCRDAIDQDCDGDTSDADPSDEVAWFIDRDVDGWGDEALSGVQDCGPTGEYTAQRTGDCDDADKRAFPGATERPNGKDDDCDGASDEEPRWHDDDGDGWCDDSSVCVDGARPGDCDDTRDDNAPDLAETCADAVDNDCDGNANDRDAVGCEVYSSDGDGDGWGSVSQSVCQCAADAVHPLHVTGELDCDDGEADVYPGQTAYFTSRHPGGWDYDCTFAVERDPPEEYIASCGWFPGLGCIFQPGWEDAVPECGASGYFYTRCGASPLCALSGRQLKTVGCH